MLYKCYEQRFKPVTIIISVIYKTIIYFTDNKKKQLVTHKSD